MSVGYSLLNDDPSDKIGEKIIPLPTSTTEGEGGREERSLEKSSDFLAEASAS